MAGQTESCTTPSPQGQLSRSDGDAKIIGICIKRLMLQQKLSRTTARVMVSELVITLTKHIQDINVELFTAECGVVKENLEL